MTPTAPTREERADLTRSVRDFDESMSTQSNLLSSNDPLVIKPGHFKKEDNFEVMDHHYRDDFDDNLDDFYGDNDFES